MTTVATTLRTSTVVRRAAPLAEGSTVTKHVIESDLSWPDGSGTSQADEVWSYNKALPAGTETHDLNSLTQTDDDGNTLRSSISFDLVKRLVIRNNNTAGAAGILRVGADAGGTPFEGSGTPFVSAGSTIDVVAGGEFVWTSPVGGDCSAGANDLKVVAAGATVDYDILVVGDAT